jgi:hypothetical protein
MKRHLYDQLIDEDFSDADWLVLLEDSGPNGMGRVIGFAVFKTEAAAMAPSRGGLCSDLGMFVGEDIPDDVVTEVMTFADFKASYGNRMPLHNRLTSEE